MQPVCTAGQALEQVARQITFDFQILPHDDGLETGSTVDIGGEVHGVERILVLQVTRSTARIALSLPSTQEHNPRRNSPTCCALRTSAYAQQVGECTPSTAENPHPGTGWGSRAPPAGLEPATVRLTVGSSAN